MPEFTTRNRNEPDLRLKTTSTPGAKFARPLEIIQKKNLTVRNKGKTEIQIGDSKIRHKVLYSQNWRLKNLKLDSFSL